MSLSKFDVIWEIKSKYSFDFSNVSEHESLQCIICKNVMTSAVLNIDCGCQYCYKCIDKYISGEDKYCPGGKQECREEFIRIGGNAFKSPLLNKRISNLKVKCPYESCDCIVELLEMDNHMRLCTKQPTECPYAVIGCSSEKASKDSILSHLNSAGMTHSELLIELITNLKNEVSGLTEDLKKSKFEISNELADKENRIVTLERENERKYREIEMLTAAVNDLKENTVTTNLEIKSLKEELLEKENKIVALEGELKEKEINEQRRHIEDTLIAGENVGAKPHDERNDFDKIREERKMDDGKKRMNKCNKLFPDIDADFVFRFDKLSKNIKKELLSEPFYSNRYRFCLSLCIYADYIYLDCYIMNGDNDERVEWPLVQIITLCIVDRNSLEPYTSETRQKTFYGATDKRNRFEGRYTDIRYSSIKYNPSVVVDDSIIVSCVLSDH